MTSTEKIATLTRISRLKAEQTANAAMFESLSVAEGSLRNMRRAFNDRWRTADRELDALARKLEDEA